MMDEIDYLLQMLDDTFDSFVANHWPRTFDEPATLDVLCYANSRRLKLYAPKKLIDHLNKTAKRHDRFAKCRHEPAVSDGTLVAHRCDIRLMQHLVEPHIGYGASCSVLDLPYDHEKWCPALLKVLDHADEQMRQYIATTNHGVFFD